MVETQRLVTPANDAKRRKAVFAASAGYDPRRKFAIKTLGGGHGREAGFARMSAKAWRVGIRRFDAITREAKSIFLRKGLPRLKKGRRSSRLQCVTNSRPEIEEGPSQSHAADSGGRGRRSSLIRHGVGFLMLECLGRPPANSKRPRKHAGLLQRGRRLLINRHARPSTCSDVLEARKQPGRLPA